MHVATAIALLIYFWREWVRIIGRVYLRTRTLYPFAAYCVIVGVGSIAYLSLR